MVFSIIVFWNIIGMRLFFGTPINPVTLFAAALGVAGVVLVFWPEIANFSTSSRGGARSRLFALVGTVAASLGNLAALRNQKHHIPIVPQIGLGDVLRHDLHRDLRRRVRETTFSFDWSISYVLSLIYLALFGSVLAFAFYLTLIKRIGADRAGYIGVAMPIVALLLSTLFEDLQLGQSSWCWACCFASPATC